MRMHCSKCGKETEGSGKYCQWCGAELVRPPRLLLRHKATVQTERFSGLGRRFVAFIVDLLFILLIDLFLIGLLGLSEGIRMVYQYARHLPMTDRAGQVVYAVVPFQVIIAFFILIIIVPWIYYAYLESSRNQATLGKMALRIAVTDCDGNRVTFSRATLRHFAKILIILTIFIGYIILQFTKCKQALQDMAAGTLMFVQE
jgi:uncharacterized RDD family membrane protein YckC